MIRFFFHCWVSLLSFSFCAFTRTSPYGMAYFSPLSYFLSSLLHFQSLPLFCLFSGLTLFSTTSCLVSLAFILPMDTFCLLPSGHTLHLSFFNNSNNNKPSSWTFLMSLTRILHMLLNLHSINYRHAIRARPIQGGQPLHQSQCLHAAGLLIAPSCQTFLLIAAHHAGALWHRLLFCDITQECFTHL